MARISILFAGCLLVIDLVSAANGYAAHPLTTDDTGTQGKGKGQLEFVAEYEHEAEADTVTDSLVFPTVPVLSYGLDNNTDLVLGTPFEWIRSCRGDVTAKASGMSDSSLQLKSRFFESGVVSFAVKPGLSLPSGDEKRGLGNGAVSYSFFFISTAQAAGAALHFNLGLLRNEFGAEDDARAQRKYIWHVSAAGEVAVLRRLTAVADIGWDRNQKKSCDRPSGFLLGGFIYKATERLDFDFGIKQGLNRPGRDLSYLGGITWRM